EHCGRCEGDCGRCFSKRETVTEGLYRCRMRLFLSNGKPFSPNGVNRGTGEYRLDILRLELDFSPFQRHRYQSGPVSRQRDGRRRCPEVSSEASALEGPIVWRLHYHCIECL